MRAAFWRHTIFIFLPIFLSALVVICFLNIPVLRDFSYEFSIAYAIVLFLFSSGYILLRRRIFGKQAIPRRALLFQLGFGLFIPLLGGAVACYNAGFDCFLHGALFYIIFSIPALITGSGLAAYSVSLSRRFAHLIWFALVLIMVFLGVLEIYRYPQLYSYNPIIGFYPGVIYDEYLPLHFRHIAYRLIAGMYFLSPIFFFHPTLANSVKLRFFKVLFPLIGLLFYFLAPAIGFASSVDTIKKRLSEQIETEHFSIFLPPNHFSPEEKLYIARLHEIYYNEDASYFNTHSSFKISSFMFLNEQQKYELTGAGAADIAKPWLNQVYILADDYSVSLKHEIAHVCASEFGAGPMKIAYGFNSVLLEGTATAADGFLAGSEINYLACLGLANNTLPDISRLYSGLQFYSANTMLAYAASGSFCEYMITKYGTENFKAWYQSGYDSTLFGKSLSGCWMDYLGEMKNLDYKCSASAAQLFFGAPPFVFKDHPRYVAAKKHDIDELIDRHQYGATVSEIERLRHFSNEPGILFRQIFLLDTLGMKEKAVQMLWDFLHRNTSSSYYFSCLRRISDLYTKMGYQDSAKAALTALYNTAPNEDYKLSAKSGLILLENGQYAKYLSADIPEKFKIAFTLYSEVHEPAILYTLIQLNNNADGDHFGQIMDAVRADISSSALPQAVGFSLCELSLRHGNSNFAKEIFRRIESRNMNGESARYRQLRERLELF